MKIHEMKWSTGIPKQKKGALVPYLATIRNGGRLQVHKLLYANEYVMDPSDEGTDVPSAAVPVLDEGGDHTGEYMWTCWFWPEGQIDDTLWQCESEVVAWCRMPDPFTAKEVQP